MIREHINDIASALKSINVNPEERDLLISLVRNRTRSANLSALTVRQKLNLSYVPRWVIVPMMRQQSVADHSWRVGVIAGELAFRVQAMGVGAPYTRWVATSQAISRAVFHDIEEVSTGDIPSTAKPTSPVPKDPLDVLVKAADIIETRAWVNMWGHERVKRDILDNNDPKFEAILGALESHIPGASKVARDLLTEIGGA